MIRRRRHRSRAAEDRVDVTLPITPMLDMSFQLLAFFILTFTAPGAAEGQLDMFMPATGSAKAASPEQVDPFAMSDKDPEPETQVTIVIESEAGAIDKLIVQEKEKTTPVANVKELRTALDKLRTELGPDHAATIKLQASSKLKYAALVEVMDTCLLAKFTSVGFAPPSDLQGKP